MSLEKRYDIPEETIKKMVRDGVISCSVIRHHEIFDAYKKYMTTSNGRTKKDIFYAVAQDLGVSEETVCAVVYKLSKI